MRLQVQTALIENGFVIIPETAPWLAGARAPSSRKDILLTARR
jgi:hypothetical protein